MRHRQGDGPADLEERGRGGAAAGSAVLKSRELYVRDSFVSVLSASWWIRRYREDRNLNLSQLANLAGVSKGYLWNLENEAATRRPSAETLYAIAKALGVAMSDLMGRKLLVELSAHVPESLARFAEEDRLPEADIRMLAGIAFRGEQPQTPERWRYIYQAIRGSVGIDEEASRRY